MRESENARPLDLAFHRGGLDREFADVARPTGPQAHGRDAAHREQLTRYEPGAKPFPEGSIRWVRAHLGLLRSNSHAAKHRM
jgi:hypothetical protein